MSATAHGIVNFISSNQNAATAMLSDMIATQGGGGGARPEILPVIGALAGIASTATAVGQLGLSIGAAASNKSKGALDVELRNFGSNYLAPFSYSSDSSYISAFPGPIAPGNSDNVALTNTSTFSVDHSKFTVRLLVAADEDPVVGQAVEVDLQLAYTGGSTPGLWTLAATVDGNKQSFSSQGLVGVQFTGNSGYPSFDLFFAGIETGNGQLLVTFYDQATQLTT